MIPPSCDVLEVGCEFRVEGACCRNEMAADAGLFGLVLVRTRLGSQSQGKWHSLVRICRAASTAKSANDYEMLTTSNACARALRRQVSMISNITMARARQEVRRPFSAVMR